MSKKSESVRDWFNQNKIFFVQVKGGSLAPLNTRSEGTAPSEWDVSTLFESLKLKVFRPVEA